MTVCIDVTPKEEKKRLFENATIGADPEFVIVNQKDRCVPATHFFHQQGLAGTDGHNSIGELRPRESENVVEVVADIKNLLTKVHETIEEITTEPLEVRAGHYISSEAIGGHIHLGITDEQRNGSFRGYLINTLDNVLLDIVAPILDDPRQLRLRRENSSYGNRGQYEAKPWGIEYRPIGSWLLSPEIALINLGLAKMVYQGLMLDLGTYRTPEKTFSAYITAKKEFDEDVQLAIDLFLKLVKQKKPINWETDILRNWRIK